MKRKLICKLTGVITLIAFVGCSTSYRRPESIDDKMHRFEAKKTANLVPEMEVFPTTFKFSSERRPASVSSKKTDNNQAPMQSNKKLYFLSLLNQYIELGKFSSTKNAPTLKICPSFHTSLVDHTEKYGSVGTNKVQLSFESRYPSLSNDMVAMFPELSLPISKEATHPTVIDILRNDNQMQQYESRTMLVQQALDTHLSKTWNELSELCEYGSSDNYYAYENLITHIKKEKSGFQATSNNMKVLLRTTIFSNMALLSSLERGITKKRGRGLASTIKSESYPEMVMKRMGVEWANGYFQALQRLQAQ